MNIILSILIVASAVFAQSSEDFACAQITHEALRRDCFHKQATTMAVERAAALGSDLEALRREFADMEERVEAVETAPAPEPEPETLAVAMATPMEAYASTYGLMHLPPPDPNQVVQPPGSQYAATVSDAQLSPGADSMEIYDLHRGFDKFRCNYDEECMAKPIRYVILIGKHGSNLAVMPEFGTPQQAWVDLNGDGKAEQVQYYTTSSDVVHVASSYGDKVTVTYASYIGPRAADGSPVFGRPITVTCSHRERSVFEKHTATLCSR